MKLVLSIMLLMGILGGTMNFFLATSDTARDWRTWSKAVLLGIGAAILIPLFLNTISSDLLNDVLGATEAGASALVFAGFCLIAAITSRAFIQTLADRVLAEAREAKQTATEAKAEVEKVAETVSDVVTEPERTVTTDTTAAPGAMDSPPSPASGQIRVLADDEKSFLRAMDKSKYTLRSVGGIAQQTRQSPAAVEAMLQELEAKGLVSRVQGRKGERWTLTATGRDAVRSSDFEVA